VGKSGHVAERGCLVHACESCKKIFWYQPRHHTL